MEMPWTPPVPPTPPAHTNSWLEEQRRRRARTDASHQAGRVRRNGRLVHLVETLPQTGPEPQRSPLVEGPPTAPIPALSFREEPALASPKVGGCVTCWHLRPAHERGYGNARRTCMGTGCDCTRYRAAWTWPDYGWFAFNCALVVGFLVIVAVIWAGW